ncbi:unnamed protein product, partial [Cuscuta epithymum]
MAISGFSPCNERWRNLDLYGYTGTIIQEPPKSFQLYKKLSRSIKKSKMVMIRRMLRKKKKRKSDPSTLICFSEAVGFISIHDNVLVSFVLELIHGDNVDQIEQLIY